MNYQGFEVNCIIKKKIKLACLFVLLSFFINSCSIFRNEITSDSTYKNGKLIYMETKIVKGNKTVHVIQRFDEEGALIKSDTTEYKNKK